MVSKKAPYSRSLTRSEKYDESDAPNRLIRKYGIFNIYVWECENGHTNFERFREGRNQYVSCSECDSDTYVI